MNESLEGLRVIDFTQIAVGLTCTQFKRAGLSAQAMQPGIGAVNVVPPMMSEATGGRSLSVLRPAPSLGEHTDGIRATYAKRSAQL